MNRKSVIIFLFFSVLSLVWIIISYFGYDRCWKCKLNSTDKFIDEYLKLPKVPTKNKVIVSLSTNKIKYNSIRPTINSLLNQTAHPDQIIISVNKDNQEFCPPTFKHENILILHKLSEDYGNNAVFISPLLREKDGDAKIILVDDDQVYGPELLQSLVEESEKFPDSLIYIKGYNSKSFADLDDSSDKGIFNDTINIKHGALIKPRFLDSSVIQVYDQMKYAPNATLSAFILKNINLRQIDYNESFLKSTNPDENEKKASKFYASHLKSF